MTAQIAIEKNATIGFLPQETAAAGDETVLELALADLAGAGRTRRKSSSSTNQPARSLILG